MVPKSKSRQIYLEIATPVNLKTLYTCLTLICQDFVKMSRSLFLGKLVPNLKLYQIHLKACTQEMWKVLNADLTWSSCDILFKTYIWTNWS